MNERERACDKAIASALASADQADASLKRVLADAEKAPGGHAVILIELCRASDALSAHGMGVAAAFLVRAGAQYLEQHRDRFIARATGGGA